MSLLEPQYCEITSPEGFIDPDPDISGIGVILSFIVIGSMVMVLSTFQIWNHYYKKDFTQELKQVFKKDFKKDFKTLLKILSLLCPWPTSAPEGERWPNLGDAKVQLGKQRDALRLAQGGRPSTLIETLLSLSDTQFATGIAILVATVAKRDITLYHALICDEMAWLAWLTASTAHIGEVVELTYTVAASNSEEVVQLSYTARNPIRIFLMWILLFLITYLELYLNYDIDLYEHIYEYGATPSADGPAIFMYFWAYASLILISLEIYPPASILMLHYMESYLAWILPPNPLPYPLPSDVSTQLVPGVYNPLSCIVAFLFRAIFCIGVVFLWVPVWAAHVAVYWLFFHPFFNSVIGYYYFITGCRSIFSLREQGRDYMKPEEVGNEDQFGFGQVVALTLLISFVLNNIDIWIGKPHITRQRFRQD